MQFNNKDKAAQVCTSVFSAYGSLLGENPTMKTFLRDLLTGIKNKLAHQKRRIEEYKKKAETAEELGLQYEVQSCKNRKMQYEREHKEWRKRYKWFTESR